MLGRTLLKTLQKNTNEDLRIYSSSNLLCNECVKAAFINYLQ